MQRQNSKHVTVQKPLDLIGTLKSWRSYKADQLLLGLTKTGPLKCENNAACCVEQLFLLKLAYGSGFFCFVFCLINSSVLLLCRLWVRMCGEYYCLNATPVQILFQTVMQCKNENGPAYYFQLTYILLLNLNITAQQFICICLDSSTLLSLPGHLTSVSLVCE